MERSELKNSLDDWNDVFLRKLDSLRPRCLPELAPQGMATGLIGVRRSGKTSQAIAMTRLFPPQQVFYYNFEDPLFYLEATVSRLEALWVLAQEYRPQGIACVVLDEIQNVDGWERWVRKLIALGKQRIIITGSSAKLLSSEIATALAGRCLQYETWPLSFDEVLSFSEQPDKPSLQKQRSVLRQILQWGAFPEVVLQADTGNALKKKILRQYVTDIVLKDVMTRHQIRNKRALDQILTYYFTNPSSLHSYNAVKKAFGINVDTVSAYTAALSEAYVIFEVTRYHPNLKVQVRDPKKVYVIDPGLRNTNSRSASEDTGKLLENLVYLELRRREKEVSYFKGKQEVDFLITENYEPTTAIQVCADASDPKTYQREVNALLECMNATGLSSGLCITVDRQEIVKVDGKQIEFVPARIFLRDSFVL